jgi:tRNA C32,U32 (ribose-2'-O)-methylase TrmJ
MNLGQAAALVAYELSRAAKPGRIQTPELSPAPAEQTEALVNGFLSAFTALDYMQGVPLKIQARRVRDTILRLKPCRKDAGLVLAVLRRVGLSRS